MKERKRKTEKGKVWLKREMSSYQPLIFFLCGLSVFSTLFSLAFAYLMRYLINSASAGNAKQLLIFAVVLLVVLLLRILINIANNYFSERGRAKIVTELRSKTFSKILKSDYASVEKYHSGDLMNRLTSDVLEVSVSTVGLAPSMTGMSVQCIGAIVALLTIDPWFTLLYVVAGCVLGGLVSLFRKGVKQRQKELLETDGETRAFMQEGISSVLTVKAYGAEDKTSEKSNSLLAEYFSKRMKRNVLRSSMSGLFSLLSNFGLIFAVVWCSVSIYQGNTDYGSVLSVVLLLQQLQQPLVSFSSVIPVFYSRLVSCERLAEIDELPKEETSQADIFNDYDTLCSFDLKELSFGYDREEIFSSASISLPAKRIICVTGNSGSGKSTLFRLLMNVYQPTAGGIYLRFKNDKKLLTAKERGLFAYVPQGNFLFSGTIYENLTFFCDGTLKDEDLQNAIRIACAEFVYDLPQGMETKLCERGAGLSEGQLQRLAIARALISNRPVLLLDESTSALDAETEKKVLENLKTLQNKTCLIVTHRPAALEIADEIVRVEDGKIVASN